MLGGLLGLSIQAKNWGRGGVFQSGNGSMLCSTAAVHLGDYGPDEENFFFVNGL